jgi:1-deoxy-D-xylulose-5-phosphate synthase
MPDGTGLTHFARKYPNRFFNVGIAEQHAVTFAAGQACAGAKPVVAIYSTFLQRAYDQIVHDVCLQNLPVVFALDRGGIVGEDGPTHHGVFDLSYLRHIPNMTLMVPKDGSELPDMLLTALSMNSPVALRYPRGEARKTQRTPIKRLPIGKSELLRNGNDVAIIAVGPMVACAMNAAAELERLRIQARVINARFVKPLDQAAIISAASECGTVVLAEENAGQGGFSSAVLECLAKNHALPQTVEIVALPDLFLEHGKSSELRAKFGLSALGILDAVNRAILRSSQHERIDRGEDIVIRQSI